jgi:hypothetical protein
MTEKVSERVMGYGWRLFGIAFLLMLLYVIVWTYTFARYYIGLIHPEVKEVLPQLPDTVYRAIAIVIVLLSAIFELRANYAIYKALMAELKKVNS